MRSKIVKLEEKTRARRAYRKDPLDPSSEVVVERESLGWFATLEGNLASLRVGDDDSGVKVGDQVTIAIG